MSNRCASVLIALLLATTGALSQSREVQVPQAPEAPTSTDECANFTKAVSALSKSMDDAHWACVSANSKGGGLFDTGDGRRTCTVAACQKYHDFTIYGDRSVPKELDRQVSACYEQVRGYQQRLATEEHVIQQNSEQQRNAIAAQGRAQVGALDASRASAGTQQDRLNQQAAQQRQRTDDSRRLADIYRRQAENAAGLSPMLSAADLAALERANREADMTARAYSLAIDRSGANSATALDLSAGDFRNAVADLIRNDSVDILKFGIGQSDETAAALLDAGERVTAIWENFAGTYDDTKSLLGGQSTEEKVRGATGLLKRTGQLGMADVAQPVFSEGVDTIVQVYSRAFAMLDHAFSQPSLFNTNPYSDSSGSFDVADMNRDLNKIGYAVSSMIPGFDKLQRLANAVDAGGRIIHTGADAFYKFLGQ